MLLQLNIKYFKQADRGICVLIRKHYVVCNIISLIFIFFITACNEPNADTSQLSSKKLEVVEPADSPKKDNGKNITKSKATANIVFGEQTYQLDQVVCIRGPMASAVAYDSQNRKDFPVVDIKTFSEAFGGPASNSTSIQIETPTGKQLWQLHEGEVENSEKKFTASGTLQGMRLEPLADGNLKPVPLKGNNIKPFNITVKCK